MCFCAQAQVSSNCAPPSTDEVFLKKGDFTALIKNETAAKETFEATYADSRRLDSRAFWSATENSYTFIRSGKTLRLPEKFINSLRRHIEIALERSYAEYVFYPDMGHAHLLIPDNKDPMLTDPAEGFEELIAHDDLKFLYHTAELYLLRENTSGKLLGSHWWNWRYFSRNMIGDNKGGNGIHVVYSDNEFYNTVREIKDHEERARVYISANQNGCFSYAHKGRTVNFDIRFE